MERIRRIRYKFLRKFIGFMSCGLIIHGCSEKFSNGTEVKLDFIVHNENFQTKAYEPNENKLNDVHIFIFNQEGELEAKKSLTLRELDLVENEFKCTIMLPIGKIVDVYACANYGYTPKVTSIDDIKNLKCHIIYPDDYRDGIPMSCILYKVKAFKDRDIVLNFDRIMSKISIKIDRSHLSDDVQININRVKIGNCPRNAYVFNENRISSEDDLFANGFFRNKEECALLNINDRNGISGEISLYMLENMQGIIENSDGTAAGKIFPKTDERSRYASYIEIGLDYQSSKYFTQEKELKYRFWLGKDNRDINIERNCHYHIKIKPEKDGLSAEGWRIDKTGLREVNPYTSFQIMPSKYIEGLVGDYIHLWCEYSPSYAPFNIGIEELENDKARGIYDYTIDSDGKGVVLHLLKKGQGILYMSAGEPINESDIAYIEIMEPKP